MKKKIRKNEIKVIRKMSKNIIKQEKGITLISLVITIIILLILAGVTLSLTLGDRGIITQAQKAKEAQEIAAIKEDMQLAILDKELEKGGTGLTKEELEEIAGNYGELQEDGNTIKTDEGYEIKIDEIYQEGGGTIGGDAVTDEEIAELQQKIEELEKTIEDLENKQSTGTAVASEVLEGKTFSNSSSAGLTGTMPNRGALNWNPSSSTTYTIPAGYYSGGTLDSSGAYNAGVAAGRTLKNTTVTATASTSQISYTQGNGLTTSMYYITVPLNFTHRFVSLYWQRTDVSSGTEYWMAESRGIACKMDSTNFIILDSYNGSDVTTKSTIYLPVSNSGETYKVIVYYI